MNNNKKGMINIIIAILAVLIILVIIILPIILAYSSIDNTTITIKDKERIQDGQESYYLVFTDNEVFKNTDTLLLWKFDSSDVYNELEVGNTYDVKVNWFRIPFLSMYRNIIDIN